jgi:hypothetical protein
MRTPVVVLAIVAVSLMALVLSPISTRPAAADHTHYFTFGPSAYHAEITINSGPTYDYGGAKVWRDGSSEDILSISGAHATVFQYDYTNPVAEAGPFELPWIVQTHAPSNATINVVSLIVAFTGTVPPANKMTVGFSTNGGTSFTQALPVHYDYSLASYTCDITSYRTWTPAMLNSTVLWAVVDFPTMPPWTIYYVDYLGFLYDWSVEYGGGYDQPDEPNPVSTEPWLPGPLSGGALIGVLGIVGFIGTIASPALLVNSMRHGERVNNFIALVSWFLISIALVWIAIHQ